MKIHYPRIYSYVFAGMALCAWQGAAHAQWVIQLQSGTEAALKQEQQVLKSAQLNATIVEVDGQPKLVLVFADKATALTALRTIQTQRPSAFVRQLPDMSAPTVDVKTPAKVVTKPTVMPKMPDPVVPSTAPTTAPRALVKAQAPVAPTLAPTLPPIKVSVDYSKLTVSNRLPGPIVPDEPIVQMSPPKVTSFIKPTAAVEAVNLKQVPVPPSVTLPKSDAMDEFWVVQLGAGNRDSLISQAKSLTPRWSDARVVEVDGKPKLVVGHFQSPGEAASSLLSLKAINAQAFVRKITSERVLFLPERPLPATKSAMVSKSGAIVTLPAVPIAAAPDVAKPEVLAAPMAAPDVSIPEPDEKLDSLPAIVAVAAPIQEAPSVVVMVVTPEEQAMRDAADLVDGEATQDRGNHWWRREAPVESRDVTAAEMIVEKRNIELPMRERPVELVTRRHSVDHVPVDLMLSPLYLLPQDAAKAKETDMTMASLSSVLQNNSLTKLLKGRDSPPEAGDKQNLMNKIAEHANAKEWLKALPLAKAAEGIEGNQLTSTDHLMLGWVWLQNQLPEKAKKYFTASMKARAQDEARYGLALSYVMMNEKRAAFNVYQQMAPSAQKSHLKTLL